MDVKGAWPEWIDVSEEGAENKIKDNAEYILKASEIYDVNPNVVAGVIYAEQSLNVNIVDTLTDWVSFYGVIDMSVGIGQVRLSTAELLEEKGYVGKTKAEEGDGSFLLLGLFMGQKLWHEKKGLKITK